MIAQTFNDVYTEELAEGAIINNEFPGFREDYLILHCLIRKYQPKSFFEIGTNMGTGTKIIKNAMGEGVLYSLDLPFEQLHPSLISIRSDGEPDLVGHNCTLPYIQLRGDSLNFEYSNYPCEGYFIDGEHDYDHCFHETVECFRQNPSIIIWHDLHVRDVRLAVINVSACWFREYTLYIVKDTRIAYAIRNNSNNI